MRCPKCNATIPSNSLFCPSCGSKTEGSISGQNSPKSDPFSSLGDLTPGKSRNNTQDNHVTSAPHHGGRTRVHYVDKDGLRRNKEGAEMKQEIPPVKKRNTLFCTGCGNPTPADSVFCEHCGKQLRAIPVRKKFQWKKLIPVAVCFVILMLGILLFPRNTAVEVSDEEVCPPDYNILYSTTKENLDSSDTGIFKMKEYEGNTWFCRISVPAWLTASAETVDTGDIWNPNYLYLFDVSEYGDLDFGSLTKGIDQMAIIGITGVSCTPVIEMDYTIPYYLAAYSGSIHYRRSIGYMIRGYNEDFEQINGQDPSAYLNRLSDRYNVFRAKKGEPFTFSYYSGTEYLEDTVVANHYYYIVGDNKTHISLPITKTTEGYFLVDYSELAPGYYLFSVGNRDTIIEVKE